jgi:hypothetical protein
VREIPDQQNRSPHIAAISTSRQIPNIEIVEEEKSSSLNQV